MKKRVFRIVILLGVVVSLCRFDCGLVDMERNNPFDPENWWLHFSSPKSIINSSNFINSYDAVFDGQYYGVVWDDNRSGNYEIYFQKVNVNGDKIGNEIRISNAEGNSIFPSICYFSNKYQIVWMDNRNGRDEVYYSSLDSNSNIIISETRVIGSTSHARYPKIDGGGLVWQDTRADQPGIYFAYITDLGLKLAIGDPEPDGVNDDVLLLAGSFNVSLPSISSYDPSGQHFDGDIAFGIVWSEFINGNFEICGTRVLIDGGISKAINQQITNASLTSAAPRIVWNGSGFGLVWIDNRDGLDNVFFITLDPFLLKTSDEKRISSSDESAHPPSVVWNGVRFGVSWYSPENRSIHFLQINSDGIEHNGIEELFLTNSSSPNPMLEWNGASFCLMWKDDSSLLLSKSH